MEEKIINKAFRKCVERGWMKELIPSRITNQEIVDFEERYQLCLPSFYKEFLMSYQLPDSRYRICGIAYKYEEITPLWLELDGISTIRELDEALNFFREDVGEFRQATPESCKMLVPIGDWGAAWGPLCLDLTKDDELADEDDESTWSLVWFDHEEFNWSEDYLGEDGLLHGTPAAPNLKTLLEWYFCGSLESEFEEENQVKLSYERLNDMVFCNSYWEERWKE